jgi:hypothetical protein
MNVQPKANAHRAVRSFAEKVPNGPTRRWLVFHFYLKAQSARPTNPVPNRFAHPQFYQVCSDREQQFPKSRITLPHENFDFTR